MDRSTHSNTAHGYDDDDLDLDMDLEDGLTHAEIARMNQHATQVMHEEEEQALRNVSQALKGGTTHATTTTVATSVDVQPHASSINGHTNQHGHTNGHTSKPRDVLWEATNNNGTVPRHSIHYRHASLDSSSVSSSPVISAHDADSQALLRKSSVTHSLL